MIRALLHAARPDQLRGKARALHREIVQAATAPLPEQRLPDALDGFLSALVRAEEHDDPARYVDAVDAMFARWPHLRDGADCAHLLEQRASAVALAALRAARVGTGATYPGRGGIA